MGAFPGERVEDVHVVKTIRYQLSRSASGWLESTSQKIQIVRIIFIVDNVDEGVDIGRTRKCARSFTKRELQ
jgi:hypothetical protein